MPRLTTYKGPLRWLLSALVVAVGFLAATGAVDEAVRHTAAGGADIQAAEYFDDALARAAYTFAVVRALNAVVSVIQDTEIAVSPAGLGVTIAVGEAVDPINDMLERFSWIMLVSVVSLGVQKVLMEIGAWLGFQVLLTAASAFLLFGLWIPRTYGFELRRLGVKLLLLSLVIRFGIPTVALTSQIVYDHFLEDRYHASAQALKRTSRDLQAEAVAGSGAEGGWLDTLKKAWASGGEGGIRDRIETLKNRMADATRFIINLCIVFVFQTVISPLLVAWALVKFFGYLTRIDLTRAFEKTASSRTGNAR